jgi:hypothetical protein
LMTDAPGEARPRRRGGSGLDVAAFTLIEVAAAAAVLTVSLLAGGALATLALRHAADVGGRAADRDAALEALWDLDRLPFVVAGQGRSLVKEVFPHSMVARSTADAWYVAHEAERFADGSFVTRRRVAGQDLLLVARFLRRDEHGAWSAVDDLTIGGRDFSTCATPPALLVEIRRERAAGATVLVSRTYTARSDGEGATR